MNVAPKISVNLVCWNHLPHLKNCLDNVLKQDYPNFELIFIDNNSSDGSEEFVRQNFPQVKVLQTGRNTGYAGGHNIGISKSDGEFVMLLTPDIEMPVNFLSELIKPLLQDEKIAGAQGKQVRREERAGKKLIDSTGIFLNTSRRPFDRGQNELDSGQYDRAGEVFGCNGAAVLYRRSALEDIALDGEILDEDIFAYWDDVDLAWRLRAYGWKLWYEAPAVLIHGRAAGASPGGYKKIFSLIKHRRSTISLFAKKLSLKNNILVLVKNDQGWPFWSRLPLIAVRQILILGYSLLIEPKTFAVLPMMFKQLPKAFRKRQFIKKHRRVSPKEVAQWFVPRSFWI
ncbi:MAG: hypothetical protein A3J48_03905 [Candidatus Doudnabacteria bacterium RIFCSPHIGHO2_02_FULL_46_11]|uniref:Glycosyltransferase 2-like domain-containing protein n=1 Tax=Candidatus Doudnabacteria bacterium RIFCSPHIGHO2_02_FULL_46_11 TaxID=1817832 RepID=A0A1F5P802_9BACT|nr:MAG: hypothetical protein A3J48_03905 [Candidatus Doudnabacteria bacterium RIFCSPHIGHO2_02_FULL_46_11]